jgi:hypothetical protein
MKSSTGLPSTKRTDLAARARPLAKGVAFGLALARGALQGNRPEVPPHLHLPRRTWLFAPACGVLIASCAVLAAWHTSSRLDSSGFDLRIAPTSFNVDTNSAGAVDAVPAPPPRPTLDTSRAGQEDSGSPQFRIGPVSPKPSAPPTEGAPRGESPVIDLPPLGPPPVPAPDAPPLTMGPLLPPAEHSESLRDLQRGDITMPQMKKMFGLPIALAAVLTGQPLAMAAPEDPPKSAPTAEQMAKDIKELKESQKTSSDALMEQLKILHEQLRSVEGLRKDVDGLKNTVQSINVAMELTTQSLKAKSAEVAEAQATLKQLRDDLEKARAQAGKMQDQITAHAARCDGLTEELTDLKKRLSETSRQAARMVEGTGTIRLYNTYGQPVSIVLNGRSYQLNPGESHTLSNQPIGPVSYEVLGWSAKTTRNLTADRPLDIEVFDLARGPVKTPPAR